MDWEVIKWAYFVDTILRLMFLFSKTKFNDASSHICKVNTEERCVWESKTETEFIGNKICPREHVQEVSVYFYVCLLQGRFPDLLWHSSLKSHPMSAIYHYWDCKSHHLLFLKSPLWVYDYYGRQNLADTGWRNFSWSWLEFYLKMGQWVLRYLRYKAYRLSIVCNFVLQAETF